MMSESKTLANYSIIDNCHVGGGFYRLTLPSSTRRPRPGQFATLALDRGILRRPMAYCDHGDDVHGVDCQSFLYQVRGPATRELSQYSTGSVISCLGPLGNSFPLSEENNTNCKNIPLLIGGGSGIGPLLYLARSLYRTGVATIEVIVGGRRESRLPMLALNGLRDAPYHLTICTDDGSFGVAGSIVEPLNRLPDDSYQIYCCGPTAMIEAVEEWSQSRALSGWKTVEEWMACGVGCCGGCARSDGRLVCKDGPVFALGD